MLRTISLGRTRALHPAVGLRLPISLMTAAFASLRDGLAASRHYGRLLSGGTTHDAALRDAFGVGPAPSRPIHFAGRM